MDQGNIASKQKAGFPIVKGSLGPPYASHLRESMVFSSLQPSLTTTRTRVRSEAMTTSTLVTSGWNREEMDDGCPAQRI